MLEPPPLEPDVADNGVVLEPVSTPIERYRYTGRNGRRSGKYTAYVRRVLSHPFKPGDVVSIGRSGRGRVAWVVTDYTDQSVTVSRNDGQEHRVESRTLEYGDLVRIYPYQSPRPSDHAKVRVLGHRQRGCLEALHHHGKWPAHWTYGTQSETVRILDSLVTRGLVRRTATGVYRPVETDQSV